MTEDMLPAQILGAVLIGLVLGVVTRRRGLPPVTLGLSGGGAYVMLWCVVGYAMVGIPRSFAKLIAGTLLVLPGIAVLLGGPLCGAFALSYWLTPARATTP